MVRRTVFAGTLALALGACAGYAGSQGMNEGPDRRYDRIEDIRSTRSLTGTDASTDTSYDRLEAMRASRAIKVVRDTSYDRLEIIRANR